MSMYHTRLALGLLFACALPAAAGAADLKVDITWPAGGDTDLTEPELVIRGRTFNAAAEGALTRNALRAFYWSGVFTAPYPVPHVPAAGEYPGRNSEPATNPWSYVNDWIYDSSAFRATNGIAGSATGQWMPPYIYRRCIGQVTNSGDDNFGFADYFSVRMEGRLVITNAGTYTFSGSADDQVVLWLDETKVFDSRLPGRYPGTASVSTGSHAFAAEFAEYGGGQHYAFSLDSTAGATWYANAPDEHRFSVGRLELGRVMTEQRAGCFYATVRQNMDGSGPQVGNPFHYAAPPLDDFGFGGPLTNITETFRLYLTGYWFVPQDGAYDFFGSADDSYAFAISDNPTNNPHAIPVVIDNNGGTPAPASCEGLPLTRGWRPVRFEFGDNTGGAYYTFYWKPNGHPSWGTFSAADFKSTDEPVFSFVVLTNIAQQVPGTGVLYRLPMPYNWFGSNLTLRLTTYASDHSYTQEVVSFTPRAANSGKPIIENRFATNVTLTTACMNGFLWSTGSAACTVGVYWGPADGGAPTSRLWQATNWFPAGRWSAGSWPTTNITYGAGNRYYYYRYGATNSAGADWPDTSETFLAGDVWVDVTDASATEADQGSGTFEIRRPAWATNEALTVRYALGGTATEGTDYTVSPTGTSRVIPEGATSVTVTVTAAIDDNPHETNETIVLRLLPGPYRMGSPASNTVVIADYVFHDMDLQAHISVPTPGRFGSNSRKIKITGRAFNAAGEAALTGNALRAFYWDTASPEFLLWHLYPALPAAGEISIGRNSELATNPVSVAGGWVLDNAAFRSANGVAGTATDQWYPPYILRRCLGRKAVTGDDAFSRYAEDFGVRMEGRLFVTTPGTYDITGSGDDRLRIWVDAVKAYDTAYSYRYTGRVSLDAGWHGFTVDVDDSSGAQSYSVNLPPAAGATPWASGADEHIFAAARLDLWRPFRERVAGSLTAVVRQNWDGSGAAMCERYHYVPPVREDYGYLGPLTNTFDQYRLILTGYWNVPSNGNYSFTGWADDYYVFAISNNPAANPETLARTIDNDGGTAQPGSITGVSLTAGWRPVRFEFGEAGGGALFGFYWGYDGQPLNNYFTADRLGTSTNLTFAWQPLAAYRAEVPDTEVLYEWTVPDELWDTNLTLRLRTFGTDNTFEEHTVSFTPTYLPGTILLLE